MSSSGAGDAPAGFVDAKSSDPPADEDTVFVPAYSPDPTADVDMVPAPGGDPTRASAVDVSDLSWWGDESAPDEDEFEDRDAPYAAPLDQPVRPPSVPPSEGSDVFDRGGVPRPLRAGLIARAPALPRSSSTPHRPSLEPQAPLVQGEGLTVSELARHARRARAEVISEPAPRRRALPEPSTPRPPADSALSESPPRSYPKMLALLDDPSAVPAGSDPLPGPKPPAVPGTFFPKGKVRKATPEDGPDVDAMLGTMADGLLVGGDGSGSSEVLVTLRDDFFRGTELHVSFEDGLIAAHLVPPDYETYYQLNGEMDRLRKHLESRGVRVGEINVREP